MGDDTILLEAPGAHVRVITFNRPQARNAITTAMQVQLDALLRELEKDDQVRAVVITGAGDQAFSAGYDIRELSAFDAAAMQANYDERRALVWNLAVFPKPLIGAIRGVAHGGGAILATLCDIRVGSAQTDFRFTAAAYGGVNNTWQLPRLVGLPKALEYTLTARRIGGEEALRAGLLNQLVAPETVLDAAVEMASQIAAHPPAGVQGHKALLQASLDRGLEAAYAAENALMAASFKPASPAALFDGVLGKKPAG